MDPSIITDHFVLAPETEGKYAKACLPPHSSLKSGGVTNSKFLRLGADMSSPAQTLSRSKEIFIPCEYFGTATETRH